MSLDDDKYIPIFYGLCRNPSPLNFQPPSSSDNMVETSPTPQLPLRIGTRRSNLAMVQTEGIWDRLQKIGPDRTYEIEALRTAGDRDQLTALYDFGAKSLWTTELEEKLTSGELDVIVHCLKGNTRIPFRSSFDELQCRV